MLEGLTGFRNTQNCNLIMEKPLSHAVTVMVCIQYLWAQSESLRI